MRKAQDDAMARTAAERVVGDVVAPSTDGQVDELARTVLGEFEAVQFETAVSKVGGKPIALRRLVITGPWEVDPGQR